MSYRRRLPTHLVRTLHHGLFAERRGTELTKYINDEAANEYCSPDHKVPYHDRVLLRLVTEIAAIPSCKFLQKLLLDCAAHLKSLSDATRFGTPLCGAVTLEKFMMAERKFLPIALGMEGAPGITVSAIMGAAIGNDIELLLWGFANLGCGLVVIDSIQDMTCVSAIVNMNHDMLKVLLDKGFRMSAWMPGMDNELRNGALELLRTHMPQLEDEVFDYD